jgi:ketosteroid isomerase-like protein
VSPKEIVQDMFQAFAQGDIARLLNHCAVSCEWIVPGSSLVPTAGRYVGKQEIGHFFARVSETMQFDLFEVREFIAENDRVVVLGRTTARYPGSDEKISSDWTMVFTFGGNKVIRFQQFYDTAPVERVFEGALTALA